MMTPVLTGFDLEMEVKLSRVVGKGVSRKISSPIRRRKNAAYMQAEVWGWEGGVVLFFALQMGAETAVMGYGRYLGCIWTRDAEEQQQRRFGS